jgi:hypothetical protein
MEKKNEPSKEELLAEIEELIAYGDDKPTIDPALLAYLDRDTLLSTKASLLKRVNRLSDEDKEWLQQFRKEE